MKHKNSDNINVKYLMEESKNADMSIKKNNKYIIETGYKGKSDKEYQREYHLKNKYASQEYRREYKNEYYLKNPDRILSIKAEHYRNKVKEGNKNENNVVTVSKEIIISILEN